MGSMSFKSRSRWVTGFLNSIRRKVCDESALASETYRPYGYVWKITLAASGLLTRLLLLWLTSAAACSVCVDSAADLNSLNWRMMLTLIMCLFLHFAVNTVALRGCWGTNTRSILTADWARRKDFSIRDKKKYTKHWFKVFLPAYFRQNLNVCWDYTNFSCCCCWKPVSHRSNKPS